MRRLLLLLPALVAVIALGLLPVEQSQAQNGAVWRAQFFNDLFLTDPPDAETTYSEINLDWGTGSPVEGINADNFSARFTATTFFEAGTYRFVVQADDSFQLGVDQRRVLETFAQPRPGDVLTVDVELTEGNHTIQLDYREITATAYVRLNWSQISTGETTFGGGTWQAEYFPNPTFALFPTVVREETSPNSDFGLDAPLPNFPEDNFSVRWTTQQLLEAGTYSVAVRGDNGVRVIVDGETRIDQINGVPGERYTATFDLPAGQHTFVVELVELTGAAFIEYQLVRGSIAGADAPITGPSVTVNAGRLNVRSSGSLDARILTQVTRGSVYPVVGQSADGAWIQINVGGTIGWVSADFVTLSDAGAVPTATEEPEAEPTAEAADEEDEDVHTTGITLEALANVNLRSGPSLNDESLLVVPLGSTLEVIARTAETNWLRVSFDGTVGWVSIEFVGSDDPIDFQVIPVE